MTGVIWCLNVTSLKMILWLKVILCLKMNDWEECLRLG